MTDVLCRDGRMKLIPERRYLIFCTAQLDKSYFVTQWFAASYHTDGGKKTWFMIEHQSEFLRRNHDANFVDPAAILEIRNLPREPSNGKCSIPSIYHYRFPQK